MIYRDSVYGRVEITEPVLLKLMGSKPLHRLKGVNQTGPTYLFRKAPALTRFGHSVGVMLLLKRLGASLEEQIAGLLHDVSHLAFSHSIDFALREETHDTHEGLKEAFLRESDIPDILAEFGFGVDVLDETKHGLLERELPDLCADRLDYFYRDMLALGAITRDQIRKNMDSLLVRDGEIIFSDKDSALFFARKYIKANKIWWAEPRIIFDCRIMGEMLKLAMERGYMKMEDMLATDKEMVDRLRASGDREIAELMDILHKGRFKVVDSGPHDYVVKPKVRIADPKVAGQGRLSSVSPEYKKEMEQARKWFARGALIKIL